MLAIFGSFFSFGIGDSKDCYGKYAKYGPFKKMLGVLPQCPDEIGARFYLYANDIRKPIDREELDDSDESVLASSHYNITRRTIITCHGWTECSNGYYDWGIRMKDALLNKGDFNVIMTDWNAGAHEDYEVSAASTQLVGAKMAELVHFLISHNGNSREFADNFYLIGFSLGAQIAGFAGRYLQEKHSIKIGRITGLDPAGPFFKGTENAFHLDKTDAKFVDIVHTFMPNIGTPDHVGHADFFPNGGSLQPGCAKEILDVTFTVGCNHLRATEFYIKTVTEECPNKFKANPCSSYLAFKIPGFCNGCPERGCPLMGFKAEETHPTGDFYLETSPLYTLCPK